MNLLRVIPFLLLSACLTEANAQADRYPAISAKKTNVKNPLSPDPIFSFQWSNPKATDGLECYELKPINWNSTNNTSFHTKSIKKTELIEVRGTGSIRFDFGRVSAGWLEFESEDLVDSISMSISEYNEPAIVNIGSVSPVKTKKPVKYGNTYRLELNPELYEGVRFGWLHVHTYTKRWHLRNIRLICQTKPVNYQGSFSCSDPELTRIWYTGAYTVKLNLQKDYFGAILMERSDRHSWTGDAYPSQAAAMVAFGNYDFVKANLINTSGLNNGIASYSLYWVLSLIDYINYTGDDEFAFKYIDNISKKLDLAFEHFGKSPSLGFYGWDERLGAGFENPNIQEAQQAYSMLSIRAWREFGQLMKQLGKIEISAKYLDYAAQKMNDIREEGTWLNRYGIHAGADAINTRMLSEKECAELYYTNFSDRINRLSYSPFNQYFILNAQSVSGNYSDALSSVRDYWGGQLRQGATTFYEVYRPSWNALIGVNGAAPNNQCGYTSLTHPWSSGVVKWLSEEVLGIKPILPGFKTFQILPHTGETLTKISGGVYTLFGLISADFDISSGLSKISIPNGTTAEKVWVPLGGKSFKSVDIKSTSIPETEQHTSYHFRQEGDYLTINNLPAGNYKLKITYQGKNNQQRSADQPWNYQITAFRQDSLTNGNWESKFGKDGYLLFSPKKEAKNQEKLPDYLDTLVIKNQGNIHFDGSNFGAIITKDPLPTAQTITIDIPLRDKKPHQIALYFLDYDQQNRRSAVEVFDKNSLNILAPVQMVRDYRKGKYLVFNFQGSIRIRVNQVRGKNAALSGIFFDPPK